MDLNQFVTNFKAQFEDSEIENIDLNTNFKQLETWDSLTAFSVQSMIEDEYQIKITNDDIKVCATVSDLFNLLISKKL
jgi:acyl carrier protein